MRKTVQIAALTVLHFALTMVLLLAALGSAMRGLDTGQPPTAGMRIIGGLGQVLLYPVFLPAGELFGRISGTASHALMLLNSLVWGAAVVGLVSLVRRWFGSSAPQAVQSGP